jgi:hypothetical protein
MRLPGTPQDRRRRGSCAKGRSHSHRDKVGPARRAKVARSKVRQRAEARGQFDGGAEPFNV